MTCNRKFVLIKYCAVGFQNEKLFVANVRGICRGVHGPLGYAPHLAPPWRSSAQPKNICLTIHLLS